MDTMVAIWLGALVVFVAIEAATVQMVCIWFAVSALVALLLALPGAPEYVQIIVFFVCTAVLLIFTRPIAKRMMGKQATPTNADRILEQTAIVLQEINNDLAQGQVKVLNQIWTARSISGDILPVDSKVVVRSIEGVKVLVERFE